MLVNKTGDAVTKIIKNIGLAGGTWNQREHSNH
jgi:hypothetical protein